MALERHTWRLYRSLPVSRLLDACACTCCFGRRKAGRVGTRDFSRGVARVLVRLIACSRQAGRRSEHRVRDSAQEPRIVRYIEKISVASGLGATVEDLSSSKASMNR